MDETEEANEEQQLDEIYEDIYNEMLDEVFGENNQRMTRSEYIAKMTSGTGKKYLSAVELRKIVDKHLSGKNLKSYLKEQVDDKGKLRASDDKGIKDDTAVNAN